MHNSAPPDQISTPFLFGLCLGLIQLAIYLPLIGLPVIGSSSEAREIHVASTVFAEQEWILPLRNGILPSKPPLYHWCVAAIGNLFGAVDPFLARLVSLIFGCATLVLLAWFVRRQSFQGAEADTPYWSVLILCLCYSFAHMLTQAMVDMTFVFWVTAALCAVFWNLGDYRRQAPSPGSFGIFLFWVFSGLAVLAKGPLGVVFPLLLGGLGLIYALGIRAALRLFLKPSLGWLAFICLTVSWYVLAAGQGSDAFISRQIFFENIERFLGGEEINREAPWFYVTSLLRTTCPWIIIFILALPGLYERTKTKLRDRSNRQVNVADLSGLIFFAGMIFLSCASGKRHTYVLPLLPWFALFVGHRISIWISSQSDSALGWLLKLRREFFFGLLVLALLLLGLVEYAKTDLVWSNPGFSLGFTWLRHNWAWLQIVLGISALAFFINSQQKSIQSFISGYIGLVGILAVLISLGFGIKNELRDFPNAAKIIAKHISEPEKLTLIKTKPDELFDPVLYYLPRQTKVVLLEKNQIDWKPEWANSALLLRLSLAEQLSKHALEQYNYQCRTIVDISQPMDALKGKTDRVMRLMRCQGQGPLARDELGRVDPDSAPRPW